MPDTTEKLARVLIVDDNRDTAIALKCLMEAAGYEAEACFDGPSALAAATRHTPDACVVDVGMPGMDGYELAQLLRDNDPAHAPVLAVLTAYDGPRHLDKAAWAGFDLHFSKPTDPAELIDQLRHTLGR